MTDPRKPVFDAVREKLPDIWSDPGNILAMDNLLDAFGFPRSASGHDFPAILAKVLVHEGGYSNHPKDPGGATMKGVTQRTYDAWRDSVSKPRQDVRGLTNTELQAIYKRDYWDAVRGDDLPPGVNYAVFDFAVNSGINRASRHLQRVVGANQDGKIGIKTLALLSRQSSTHVIDEICDVRMAFLRSLKTWPTFGKGWLRRVESVRIDAKAMAS